MPPPTILSNITLVFGVPPAGFSWALWLRAPESQAFELFAKSVQQKSRTSDKIRCEFRIRNFQATKPACSISPRNTVAAQIAASCSLPPSFPTVPGHGALHPDWKLSCHGPRAAGLRAGFSAGSLCCSHGQRDSASPGWHWISPAGHPSKHWLTLHYSQALTPHRQLLCFGTHGSPLILSSFSPLKVFQNFKQTLKSMSILSVRRSHGK